MNPHISEHPIGAELPLTYKRTTRITHVARLHRREPHGEEWRVLAVNAVSGGESYLMSTGWRWVSEQLERQTDAHTATSGDHDGVSVV